MNPLAGFCSILARRRSDEPVTGLSEIVGDHPVLRDLMRHPTVASVYDEQIVIRALQMLIFEQNKGKQLSRDEIVNWALREYDEGDGDRIDTDRLSHDVIERIKQLS